MDFGERLKKLRTSKRLTQEELGKIVHVSKVSISGYERGERSPDRETLTDLADYFEVSTDYLLARTDNKQPLEQKKTVTVESALDSIMTSDGKKLSEDDKRVAADIIKRLLEDGK